MELHVLQLLGESFFYINMETRVRTPDRNAGRLARHAISKPRVLIFCHCKYFLQYLILKNVAARAVFSKLEKLRQDFLQNCTFLPLRKSSSMSENMGVNRVIK